MVCDSDDAEFWTKRVPGLSAVVLALFWIRYTIRTSDVNCRLLFFLFINITSLSGRAKMQPSFIRPGALCLFIHQCRYCCFFFVGSGFLRIFLFYCVYFPPFNDVFVCEPRNTAHINNNRKIYIIIFSDCDLFIYELSIHLYVIYLFVLLALFFSRKLHTNTHSHVIL